MNAQPSERDRHIQASKRLRTFSVTGNLPAFLSRPGECALPSGGTAAEEFVLQARRAFVDPVGRMLAHALPDLDQILVEVDLIEVTSNEV